MGRLRSVSGASFVASLVGAAALAVSGCGGGSSATAGAPKAAGKGSASEAALIASADAICKRVNAELLAVPQAKSEAASEVIPVTTKHERIERKGNAELSKLTPPSSLKAVWGLMLVDRNHLAAELVELAQDLRTNDRAAIQTLALTKTAERDSLRVTAEHAGFKHCQEVG